jgi:thiopurine S-methyltransferase
MRLTETWEDRWREGRTGWHEVSGNAGLKKHWRATGREVLVPLCGKSVDMRWLAEQGNRVVGVELSQVAVDAFFAEQKLDYAVSDDGDLRRYVARDPDITIYCGDFFSLTSIRCDAHYDRGALGALPADIRPSYAAHVSSLLTDDAEQLLITLQYDAAVANGPPFSLDDSEVLGYWSRLERVDAYEDIDNAPPKFIEAGMTSLTESVWRSK